MPNHLVRRPPTTEHRYTVPLQQFAEELARRGISGTMTVQHDDWCDTLHPTETRTFCNCYPWFRVERTR